jgi:hypothetical protein
LSIAGACAVAASRFRNARRFLIGVRNENAWIVAVCVSNPGYRISVAAGVDRGTREVRDSALHHLKLARSSAARSGAARVTTIQT